MSGPLPDPPLHASDRPRTTTLLRKISDRIRDLQRHLNALAVAMSEFGEDFDLVRFNEAFSSDDPHELNQVKAVERGVDQLYNYLVELGAFGLELAMVRGRHDDTNAATDIQRLAALGVISRARAQRLQQVRELRRLMVHDYATATAEQVHEAAGILLAEVPYFGRAIAAWMRKGFTSGAAA